MYCSSCGAALDELPPTECNSCGTHHWNDAKPAGVALVHHNGRLLLIRRATEPWRGSWDLPGGFCDEGEHPISAAEREVYEETRIRVRVTGYLGAWHARYDDPELPAGSKKASLGLFYHAVPTSDTSPKPSDETTDARWFLPEEIPDAIAFPDQQVPALRAWRRAVADGHTTTPLPDRPAP